MTTPEDGEEDWITRVHAARVLGVSEWAVARLVRAGRLTRADRPARRYSRREAEALAASRVEWVGLSEAAIVLGVSRSRVDQLARADRLPYEVVRGRRRFRRAQIEVVANARLARWHDGMTSSGESS